MCEGLNRVAFERERSRTAPGRRPNVGSAYSRNLGARLLGLTCASNVRVSAISAISRAGCYENCFVLRPLDRSVRRSCRRADIVMRFEPFALVRIATSRTIGFKMRTVACVACGLLASSWCAARAQDQQVHIVPLEEKPPAREISLPYGFYNDSFGVALAYVYAVYGYPQQQASMLATAMIGSTGSAMAFFMAQNVQMPHVKRLFTDSVFSIGYYVDSDAYIDGNPQFAGERAGSNESDPDNFVEGSGLDNFARVKFKYLLPIGDGKQQVITDYKLDRGLLVSGASGGSSWNPWGSGRTFVELRPFYRSQTVDGDDVDAELKTNGVDVVAVDRLR